MCEQVNAPKLLEAWKQLFLKAPWDPTHKASNLRASPYQQALSSILFHSFFPRFPAMSLQDLSVVRLHRGALSCDSAMYQP